MSLRNSSSGVEYGWDTYKFERLSLSPHQGRLSRIDVALPSSAINQQ